MNRFKNLEIWKRAVALATIIYRLTRNFPEEEKCGLTSQLRRCSVSAGSNIAEGAGRNSKKEFRQYLNIAYGSLYELETQLIIAQNLKILKDPDAKIILNEIVELQKMIFAFSRQLLSKK